MVEKDTVGNIAQAPLAAAASRDQSQEQKLAELQQQVAAQILAIEGNPNLSPSEKANRIDNLRSAVKGGNIRGIEAAIQNSAAAVRSEETENKISEAISYAIMEEYDLDEVQARRVRILSKAVDTSDEKSVTQFAEALVKPDMPENLRKEQVKLTAQALQKHPELLAAHNAATPQARVEAMAAYVAGQRDFVLLEKDPRYSGIKQKLERADRFGLEANPEVQKLLIAAKKGEISSDELGNKLDEHTNTQLGILKQHMNQAREILPPETQAILKTIGDGKNKAIVDLAEATLIKFKSDPAFIPNKEEKAALQSFALSRDMVITKMLGDNALTISRGISFEKETGTLEQRTERAFAYIQERMPPELANYSIDVIKSRIQNSLQAMDSKNLKIQDADTLSGKALADFSLDVTSSMLSQKAATATKTMGQGLTAMASGDIKAAEKEALSVGRGTKNTLEKIGLDKETAQTIGSAVTSTLKVGAVAGVALVQTAQDIKDVASNALNGAKIAWNAKDDIAKQVGDLKAKGWDGFVVKDAAGKDKKLFELTGDKDKDVANIRNALAKAGVNLADFDADKSGSISGKELTDAMTAAVKQQQAQLQPSNTPHLAAKNGQNTSRG
jgi:DNA-binding Lrp family transcriptional regulator